ncbi:MAG: acylphosphatase [Frankiaceae bacterium]|nr:acylphosphatase [Frankiaceae bacterium]
MTRLTAWVSGRVQGVGMRWWIRSRALELGLAGWARNTEDGRVEVVAEGPRAAAEALLDLLRAPAGAAPGWPARPGRVDLVVERWSEPASDGLSGFVER